MSKDQSKPAFPLSWTNEDNGQGGMSLREHYAGKALIGITSQEDIKFDPSVFAARAFAIADAMLAKGDKDE